MKKTDMNLTQDAIRLNQVKIIHIVSFHLHKIFLPENYSADKKYPLHIALHGWGEDISFFRNYWTSKTLKTETISLFVQSSEAATSAGFCWNNLNKGRSETEHAYRDTIGKHRIDVDSITVGGFSQGGTLAMDLSLNGNIPIKGFIALCPERPETFTRENIVTMIQKNVRGVILTGEKDGDKAEQENVVKDFIALAFPHKSKVSSGLGHWFPENPSDQIDEAMGYIQSERQQQSSIT